MTIGNIPMYAEESLFIDFEYAQQLCTGQTILSAAYSIEAGAPVTKVAGSEAINSAGNTAQARFTLGLAAVVGENYTVRCAATCQNPTEIKNLYAVIVVNQAPALV